MKTIVLIALSVSFTPISYIWYDTLSELECNKSYQNNIADSDRNHNACLSQTGTHWAIFYGVNVMLYGMPIILVLKSASRSKDL